MLCLGIFLPWKTSHRNLLDNLCIASILWIPKGSSYIALGRKLLASSPQANAADSRECEQDASSHQCTFEKIMGTNNSPERNAQSPDRLHLHARALRRSNPVAIIDAAVLVQAVRERCGEGIC
jgi:hypothetical protein